MLHVNQQLAHLRDVNGYTEAAASYKEYFHTEGKKFLHDVAKAVGIPTGTYEVRNNKGGMAVSGEVTLHSDRIYVQLQESSLHDGIDVLFRTVKNRGDYVGGANHRIPLSYIAEDGIERLDFIRRLQNLGGY